MADEPKQPILAYQERPPHLGAFKRAGVMLVIWAAVLFVVAAVPAIMAGVILIGTLIDLLTGSGGGYGAEAVCFVFGMGAIMAWMAVKFVRSGRSLVKKGMQLLRGEMPPLQGTISTTRIWEGGIYFLALGAALIGVIGSIKMAYVFSGGLAGLGATLSYTRITLNQAKRLHGVWICRAG